MRIVIFIISITALLAFPAFVGSVNSLVEQNYYLLRGTAEPDTSIIIIEINDADIESIGPWPIKRSYYALLIKHLSELNVKSIGLEIFLSAKFVTQAVYDNLLTREIQKAGNVILSSVAGTINMADGNFITDSLSYPGPKLINPEFLSGHINYISDGRYRIPLKIKADGTIESAFSLQLAGLNVNDDDKLLVVNFFSEWEKFHRYSLTELFELIESNDPELKTFSGKIVLVGSSVMIMSPRIHSIYDEDLPGVALHAFALDNLINKKGLNSGIYKLSGFLFPALVALIMFLLLITNAEPKLLFYVISFFLLFLLGYILFIVDWIVISHAAYILPLLSLALYEIGSMVYQKNKHAKGIENESNALKILLGKKENELKKLQAEFDIAGESNTGHVLEKIKSIKSDIDKMKEKEDDRLLAETTASEETKNLEGIIFRSNAMLKIAELIKKVAPEDATVLITGESGTGKELVARAIHSMSGRADKKFIAVNCGALPDNLLESELFGHVKGAFTGAAAKKQGRFEAADGGTIFLDEVGETSESFQVKLLRVLQSGEYEKLGSNETCKSDVRVISATNKNIEREVKEKSFREDLYYRLNVFRIELPPLRERREDIQILAEHFLFKENNNFRFSKAALDALNSYNWKGNVRELETMIKRAAIFARYDKRAVIRLSDLPTEVVKTIKIEFESLILDSLRAKNFSHSSISEIAKDLGSVNRTVIAENLRGISLKIYVENDFNIEKTIEQISLTDNVKVMENVRARLNKYLSNIEKDVLPYKGNDFSFVKQKFLSKYKNLPQKYHIYLDEVIKKSIS